MPLEVRDPRPADRVERRQRLDLVTPELHPDGEIFRVRGEDLDDVAAQSAWLHDRKQTTVSSLVVLDALAQMLDDRSWLQRFALDGDEVNLMVASASPSELIETLEASPIFSNVRFDSLTRDNRNATDRFNIQAKVGPPAQEDGG